MRLTSNHHWWDDNTLWVWFHQVWGNWGEFKSRNASWKLSHNLGKFFWNILLVSLSIVSQTVLFMNKSEVSACRRTLSLPYSIILIHKTVSPMFYFSMTLNSWLSLKTILSKMTYQFHHLWVTKISLTGLYVIILHLMNNLLHRQLFLRTESQWRKGYTNLMTLKHECLRA